LSPRAFFTRALRVKEVSPHATHKEVRHDGPGLGYGGQKVRKARWRYQKQESPPTFDVERLLMFRSVLGTQTGERKNRR